MCPSHPSPTRVPSRLPCLLRFNWEILYLNRLNCSLGVQRNARHDARHEIKFLNLTGKVSEKSFHSLNSIGELNLNVPNHFGVFEPQRDISTACEMIDKAPFVTGQWRFQFAFCRNWGRHRKADAANDCFGKAICFMLDCEANWLKWMCESLVVVRRELTQWQWRCF